MNANIYRAKPPEKKRWSFSIEKRGVKNFHFASVPALIYYKNKGNYHQETQREKMNERRVLSGAERVKICIRNHFYAMEMIRRKQATRPPLPPSNTYPPARYHEHHIEELFFLSVRTRGWGRVKEINSGEWEIECGEKWSEEEMLLLWERVKLKAFIERFTITQNIGLLSLSLLLFISSWFDRSHAILDVVLSRCDSHRHGGYVEKFLNP